MSTNVLDTLVGDILPHVHIKKAIVEDYSGNNDYTYVITVQMELYQRKDQLLKSSWMSDIDLNLSGPEEKITSLFDMFRLNIISVQGHKNISRLKKLPAFNNSGNSIFVHQQSDAGNIDYYTGVFGGSSKYSQSGLKFKEAQTGPPPGDPFAYKRRIPIHLGALIGLTQTDFDGNPAVLHGVREKVYKGRAYYVIPYEHKVYWRSEMSFDKIPGWDNSGSNPILNNYNLISKVHYNSAAGIVRAKDLGIVAYTSLELQSALGLPLDSPWKDVVNIESAVSAEIILEGGKPTKNREAFVTDDGKEWTGPVHYHGADNSVDGYVGYMVGKSHRPGENQPRVSVVSKPNTIVQDMSDPIQQKVPNEMFSVDALGNVVVTGKDATSNILPNYGNAKAAVEIAGGSLSVQYQKETLKDIYKSTKDNDSEFSKLYLTRDASNTARALFFIDFKQLILNNSHHIEYFRPEVRTEESTIASILEKTRIIDISVNRRRVKPDLVDTKYSAFANNTAYEEPVQKISCAYDHGSFKNLITSYSYAGAFLREVRLGTENSSYTRYFHFSDPDVQSRGSGFYQYEVKLEYFDGAAALMMQTLKKLREVKKEIDDYYKLASSSEATDIGQHEIISKHKGGKKSTSVTTKKLIYKPYYDNNYKSYSPHFSQIAHQQFEKEDGYLWVRAPKVLTEYAAYFSTNNATVMDILNTFLKTSQMLSPGPEVSGSPEGIMLCSRIFSSAISNLEKILLPKNPKSSNNSNILQDYVSTSDYQTLPESFYENFNPSTTVLLETHSFDHPKEIFKARRDTDFYVDYHTMENISVPPTYPGLKFILKERFSERCYAELLKYSPYALNPGAVHGQDNSDNLLFAGAIPRLINGSPRKDWQGFVTDKLSHTMFSYLTPALLQVSSRDQSNYGFNFTYRTFSDSIRSTLQQQVPDNLSNIYNITALNPNYANSILLVAGLFMENIIKNRNATKPEPFVIPKDILDSLPADPGYSNGKEVQSHAYKNFFSNHNITIHHNSMHAQVFGSSFEKEGGAWGMESTPSLSEWPLDSSYYTDGGARAKEFFTRILGSSKQSHLKVPSSGVSKPYPYSVNLPNLFKLKYVLEDHRSAGLPIRFLNDYYEDVLSYGDDIGNTKMNGFRFINFNMMVKVEKLVGHGVEKLGSIAKVDKWQLLTEADLTSNSEPLFCRMTYYDSSLLGGLELPIVDEYFILGEPASPLLGSFVSMDLDPVMQSTSYFNSLNQSSLKDLKNTLNKGKQKAKLAKEIVPSPLLSGADMASDDPSTAGTSTFVVDGDGGGGY